MRREEWRGRDEEHYRRMRDHDREDYGQADYSDLYGYDPRTRSGYRAYDDGRRPDVEDERPYFADRPRRGDERRAHDEHRDRDERYGRRREMHERHGRHREGPSDRVLWAVVMERLEDERRLDLRDVEVDVYDGEVTLNGTVKHKADKRRIEDIADIEGVRNVQNNLRVRDRDRRWTFL